MTPPGQKGPKCDKDIDTTGWKSANVTFVAAQNNTVCTSGEFDTYTTAGGVSYVVQAGGEQAAWTHTNVSTPSVPVLVVQFVWAARGKGTYTASLRTFRQGTSHYIVMGLERLRVAAFCGVVIYDVTTPTSPVFKSQYIGADWCDTHNVHVENDSSGDGKYIYATADATNDMRVLAVSGTYNGQTASVTSPIEIGRYTSPTANDDNYVHDVTAIDHGGATGRRAYLAYWDSGVVVLNAADVTPGTSPTPIVDPNEIDPPGFLAHHAYPNAAGTRVIIEDEFLTVSEPVQMWTVDGDDSAYVDGIANTVGKATATYPSGEPLPAHNLLVDGSTLYVGWYKAGMQVFPFNNSGFGARSAYHQVQTEPTDDPYDGAWGIRLLTLDATKYAFQSDRRYGLIISSVT